MEMNNNIYNYIMEKLDLKGEPIDEYKKFCEYVATLNTSFEKSVIDELINNDKLSSLLEIIIKKYTEFTNIDLDNLLTYNIAITIIEIYREKNSEIATIQKLEDSFDEVEAMDSGYDDNLKIYLNEISKYKILTKDETISLARRIRQGDSSAKTLFICSNLRFVLYLAKNYIGLGLDFLDLVQEGNMGLVKAVEYYNPEMGVSFVNYASYWIRHYIIRAIQNTSRNIRIPTYMHANISRYNKAVIELEETLGRSPTSLELAAKLNISESDVININKFNKDTISLQTLIGEGTDSEKDTNLLNFIKVSGDFVEDKIIPTVIGDDFKILFTKANLTEREKMVIILSYGLSGDKMNFSEIGKLYNISRERVSKLHQNAMKRLRNSDYISKFFEYTDSPSDSEEKIKMYRKNYF